MQTKIKFRIKAQSILEYVVLLGIVGMALGMMQLYFKRSIQAAVKVAADQIGDQREGLADYDFQNEWKYKGSANIITESSTSKTITKAEGGAVTYDTDDTSAQTGVLSSALWLEKK